MSWKGRRKERGEIQDIAYCNLNVNFRSQNPNLCKICTSARCMNTTCTREKFPRATCSRCRMRKTRSPLTLLGLCPVTHLDTTLTSTHDFQVASLIGSNLRGLRPTMMMREETGIMTRTEGLDIGSRTEEITRSYGHENAMSCVLDSGK